MAKSMCWLDNYVYCFWSERGRKEAEERARREEEEREREKRRIAEDEEEKKREQVGFHEISLYALFKSYLKRDRCIPGFKGRKGNTG